jgi:hypothetical protein
MSKTRKLPTIVAAIAAVVAIGAWAEAAEPTNSDSADGAIAHISAHGKVLDPEGRPRANARVILRVVGRRDDAFEDFGLLDTSDVLAEVRTDDTGSFNFERVPLDALRSKIVTTLDRGLFGADLVAMADGCGMGWTPFFGFPSREAMKVKLRPEAVLEGTVENEQGEPLADAQVEVIGISRLDYSANPLAEVVTENAKLLFSSIAPRAVTNAQGRFRIPGLPADHLIVLFARHRKHPRTYFLAAVGPHASAQPVVHKFGNNVHTTPVQVNPVKLKLAGGRSFVVRVLDENGQPPSGGRLTIFSINARGKWQDDLLPADGALGVTVPFDDSFRVIYVPPDGQPGICLDRRLSVDTTTGEMRMVLPTAREITGRVVGEGTDIGLAGVTVVWTSLAVDSPAMSMSSKAISDSQGRFRLLAAPGAGGITLIGHATGFFIDDRRPDQGKKPASYLRVVDVPATGQVEPLVIEAPRGLVIRGTVADAEGTASRGVVVGASKDVGTGLHPINAVTDDEGQFEFAGLDPRDPYVVAAIRDGSAAFVTIDGQADQPPNETRVVETHLVLEPAVTLTGRVMFEAKPLPGVKLMLNRHEPQRTREIQTVTTDDDGQFRLSGLKADDSYLIQVEPPFPAGDASWRYQSPNIQKLPDNAAGEIKLPDMNLRRLNQSLSGVVIDPDGKPIAWAGVHVMLRDGYVHVRHTMRSGPLPWTETDLDGRFELEQLPDEPLSLIAQLKTTQDTPVGIPGGPRRPSRARQPPAHVNVEMNQQDIRIVLDPSLVEEEE